MISSDATIDGRRVEVRPGEMILDAARRLELDVPALCSLPELVSQGSCRLCIVEIEGRDRPAASCHTPIVPGMIVRTETPRLLRLRRAVLSLTLSEHADDVFHASSQGNEVETLMQRLGMERSDFGHHGRRATPDTSHPLLVYDRTLCIDCRRCLHACELIQGQFVYGVAGRGAGTRLIYGPTPRFAESACTSCGACIDHCPTGAISDRDRIDGEGAAEVTNTTCGFCGVGCRLRVESACGRVLRISGVPKAAVNRGHLCVKGRYAHEWQHHRDRLRRPLLRENRRDTPRAVDWNESMDWLAQRIDRIRSEHGPDALGFIASARSTNETSYLFQKLARAVIKTNNIDCCARVCHSSTALALATTTGTGAATASFADIERARTIVVAGANPTEAHPVVGARIKQAALRGATLLVIDPRRIELAEYADLWLAVRPGANVALLNGIAKLLIENGAFDEEYVSERCDGIDDLRARLETLTIEELASTAGVEVAEIEAAARLLGERRPVLFVHGLGLSELSQGTDSVIALSNLGLLSGSVGRPGAGMLPLRGQNNVQGSADMGAMPDRFTGYQSLADPVARSRAREVWGCEPPEKPGLTIPEMLEAALQGEIRGLWIQGEDLVHTNPQEEQVIEALSRLDLLVVEDLFFCKSAHYAHLILPAASFLEVEGTFTNGERRVQHVAPVAPPPGGARPDLEIVIDLANRLRANWSYTSPAEVLDEVARVAPAAFGGLSYERLGEDGIQWPCPTREHAGTAELHSAGFSRGRGRLVPVIDRPPSDEINGDYPFVLITGRVLEQYNTASMTSRTPNSLFGGTDRLEIHPNDASRLGVCEGDHVEIASRWGATTAPAHLTGRVAPGRLFLSFHAPSTHTNRLVGPHLDPKSRCPDYKTVAVRIERALRSR